MAEVKYAPGKGTPEQRIRDRLKNSGCDTADHVVQKGDGPTRTITNLHVKGQPPAGRRIDVDRGGVKSGTRGGMNDE